MTRALVQAHPAADVLSGLQWSSMFLVSMYMFLHVSTILLTLSVSLQWRKNHCTEFDSHKPSCILAYGLWPLNELDKNLIRYLTHLLHPFALYMPSFVHAQALEPCLQHPLVSKCFKLTNKHVLQKILMRSFCLAFEAFPVAIFQGCCHWP